MEACGRRVSAIYKVIMNFFFSKDCIWMLDHQKETWTRRIFFYFSKLIGWIWDNYWRNHQSDYQFKKHLNFCLKNLEPHSPEAGDRLHTPHTILSHLLDDYFLSGFIFTHLLMLFICREAPDQELAVPQLANSCRLCRPLEDSNCLYLFTFLIQLSAKILIFLKL